MDRTERKRRIANRKKRGHWLWDVERDEDGRLGIGRKKSEEEFEMSKKASGKNVASKEDLNAYFWGLFGSSLVDDKTLTSDIPKPIVSRFNASVNLDDDTLPVVYSWEKLGRVFDEDKIRDIKKDISYGIQTRVVSKFLNIPFMAAADIVYDLGQSDRMQMKGALDLIRDGKRTTAIKKYGRLAVELSKIYTKYLKPENRRIDAVDQSAVKYWESYLGPFGKEMIREVKKRVRADLAKEWLKRYGVDQEAADYWSAYYGAYGEDWVKVVPKKISPAN